MGFKVYFISSTHPDIDRIYRHFNRLSDMALHFYSLRRALKPYQTENPDEADFAFLDINLVLFQFYNSEERPGPITDPGLFFPELESIKRKLQVLVYAPGDFGQRGLSPYEIIHEKKAYPVVYPWIDEKISLLLWESISNIGIQDLRLLPFGSVPWAFDWHLPKHPRRLKYSFCGVIKQPLLPSDHIRGGKLKTLAGYGRNWFVGEKGELFKSGFSTDTALIRNSDFTLCPAGYGRWTYRLYQSLRLGSIPVILSDGYILPNWLPWDWNDLVVRWQEADLQALPEALQSWDAQDIKKKQKNILEIKKYLKIRSYMALLLNYLETKPWVAK